MKELTVKNLDLVLNSVENEFKSYETAATKTLMNTYNNLLNQFRFNFRYDLDETSVKFLRGQSSKLKSILEHVHKMIPAYLEKHEYKQCDNLAQVSERIEYALKNISDSLKTYNRLKNLNNN